VTAHYFTADLHLGHANVIKFDSRPFESIEEHDAVITARMRPNREDTNAELWILGDVAMRREGLKEFMAEIRPHWRKIHLIRGNHDDAVAWRLRELFDSANESLYLRVNKDIKLYLSHYAHRVWRNSHHGSVHLYGHSHGDLPSYGRSMDVGCMMHDYRPVGLTTVVEKLGWRSTTHHHV
jgi:calcineurin-like phosphoesterase family protein